MDTTRTWSPYFSPNSAIAPVVSAWSRSITSVCTCEFARISSFTSRSTSASSSAVDRRVMREIETQTRRAPPRCRPASRACPALCASAACSRCVAVWLRMVELRSVPVHPRDHCVARADRRDSCDPMDDSARRRLVGVLDDRPRVSPCRRVEQHAGIAHLSAGLGVERRAVEHKFGLAVVLDHVAPPSTGASSVSRPMNSVGGQFLVHGRDLRLVRALPTGARARRAASPSPRRSPRGRWSGRARGPSPPAHRAPARRCRTA